MYLSSMRRTGAVTLAAAVFLSLLVAVPTPAVAGPVRPTHPTAQVDRSVPGRHVSTPTPLPRREAASAAARAAQTVPPSRWPAAGEATVALDAAPTTASSSVAAANRAGGSLATVGGLPVRLEAVGASTPSQVRVELLDRAAAQSAGVSGLLLRVGRADGVAAAGRARLTVDYSAFRGGYGADWASRLRLVLADGASPWHVPARPGEQRGRRDPGRRRRAAGGRRRRRRARRRRPPARPATTPPPRCSRRRPGAAGGNAGDFTWSYPMRVPPAPGRPGAGARRSATRRPAVDGRMAASNNQPSWVGEGFDWQPGLHRARYAPCADDMAGGNNAHQDRRPVLGTDNADAVAHRPLRRADQGRRDGRWHLRGDDGSRIERRTGAAQRRQRRRVLGGHHHRRHPVLLRPQPAARLGDGQGGDQLDVDRAGLRQPPRRAVPRRRRDSLHRRRGGGTSTTSSTRTATPCPTGTPRRPTSYARAQTDAADRVRPRRLPRPDRLRHPQQHRLRHRAHAGRVRRRRPLPVHLLRHAQRGQLAGHAVGPGVHRQPPCPIGVADVLDHQAAGDGHHQGVDRQRPTATVESWTLTHTFPDPGDGTRAGLWLDRISHTGPRRRRRRPCPTSPSPACRCPTGSTRPTSSPAMNWWRIAHIVTETGGSIDVTYSDAQDCVRGIADADARAHTNTLRCYPVRWTPRGRHRRRSPTTSTSTWSTAVTETDLALPSDARSPRSVTRYDVPRRPGVALHRRRRPDQGQGQDLVGVARLRPGAAWSPATPASRPAPRRVYFRGMHGDKLPSGTRSVSPAGGRRRTRGRRRRRATPAWSARRSPTTDRPAPRCGATVNEPWQSAPTATAHDRRRHRRTPATSGVARDPRPGPRSTAGRGWRRTTSRTTFDGYGMPTQRGRHRRRRGRRTTSGAR